MKLLTIFVLATVLTIGGSVGAKQLPAIGNRIFASNEDLDYGAAFMQLLEAYKKILPCGFAPWKLPPLAPFTLANWPFDFHNEFYRVSGNISNMVITGLDNFRVMEYVYNSSSGVTIFDAIYYDVQLLAEYTMDAWAMMAGFNATMAGEGPLNWKIKDARIIGQYTIATSPNNPNGLLISDFQVNVLIGDVVPGSWNNKWDISFNNFVNKWLREFIIMWVQENQAKFAEMYNAWILPGQNKALYNVSMPELIAFFEQQTVLMNASKCT